MTIRKRLKGEDLNDFTRSLLTLKESTKTAVSENELGADITGKIKDIINIGINGKISSETTNTKTITSMYTIAHQNKELGYFDYDFFADYPIVMMKSDGSFVIPIRKGSGPVETSILPITSDFFTLKNLNIR